MLTHRYSLPSEPSHQALGVEGVLAHAHPDCAIRLDCLEADHADRILWLLWQHAAHGWLLAWNLPYFLERDRREVFLDFCL